MWYKDPIPIAEHEKTRIFELRNGPQTGYTNQYLYYWDDLDEFESTNYMTRYSSSYHSILRFIYELKLFSDTTDIFHLHSKSINYSSLLNAFNLL